MTEWNARRPERDASPERDETVPRRSSEDGKRRTLVVLSVVALLLLLLPLGVALGPFGNSSRPLVVGLLPFQAPPGENDLERTAAALVEGLHQRLRGDTNPSFSFVGPSVTQRYRDSTEMPEELGRRIGADVVVVGGLRPESDSTASLSTALIRVEDGRALWTEELEVRRMSSSAERNELVEWVESRLRRALRATRVPS